MLFVSMPFLVSTRMNDPTFDIGFIGALVFGGLELIVMGVLQFIKPSRVQRLISLIVGGVIGAIVAVGWFMLILAYAALSGG